MEVMDHKQKSFKAIMVALTNNEVSVHVGEKETNGIFAGIGRNCFVILLVPIAKCSVWCEAVLSRLH